MKIWSVTYWDDDKEPVVSVFNNYTAAKRCYDYFKKRHKGCCIDECILYSYFKDDQEVV